MSASVLGQMVQAGELTGTDLIWAPGMEQWSPASAVLDSGSASGPPPVPTSAWRSGKFLIVRTGWELPLYCAFSGEPVESLSVRRLRWHHPVVGSFVSKKVDIHIGISRRARMRRIWGIVIGWVGTPTGIAGICYAAAIESGLAVLVSTGVILGSLIAAIIMTRKLRAVTITPEYVKIAGCGKRYLERFPQLPAEFAGL